MTTNNQELIKQIDDELAIKQSELNEIFAGLEQIENPPTELTWWSATNAMTMSTVLLIFFLLVMGLATYLIKHGQQANVILRLFGTLLIIAVSAFLVVAGYDDKQIAPVIGLLGTIAGYVLGKDSSKNSQTNTKREE